MLQRSRYSLICFALAGAWPSAFAALRHVFMSPYDRALAASFCGHLARTASEFAGHCPACWTGSAAFIALGVASFALTKPARVRV